jgi:hypothetical protein
MGLAVRDSGEANALQQAIETEILPRLPALEDRRAALGGSMWRDAVLLALAASVAAGLVGVAEAPAFVPFILIGAVGLGLWLHAHRRGQWQAALIEAVMPVVCRCLGNTRYRHVGDPQALMEFEALGLIGAARYRTVLHRMEGRRGGTAFVAQHASLSRTRGRRGAATRVFHGLLIEIGVARRPPCRIIIAPADRLATQIFAGVARPLLPPAYERVPTGDDAFDARFQVVIPPGSATAADQVRAYLAPGFRAALLEIDSEEARARQAGAVSARPSRTTASSSRCPGSSASASDGWLSSRRGPSSTRGACSTFRISRRRCARCGGGGHAAPDRRPPRRLAVGLPEGAIRVCPASAGRVGDGQSVGREHALQVDRAAPCRSRPSARAGSVHRGVARLVELPEQGAVRRELGRDAELGHQGVVADRMDVVALHPRPSGSTPWSSRRLTSSIVLSSRRSEELNEISFSRFRISWPLCGSSSRSIGLMWTMRMSSLLRVVEERVERRVAHVAAIPVGLEPPGSGIVDLDRLEERRQAGRGEQRVGRDLVARKTRGLPVRTFVASRRAAGPSRRRRGRSRAAPRRSCASGGS